MLCYVSRCVEYKYKCSSNTGAVQWIPCCRSYYLVLCISYDFSEQFTMFTVWCCTDGHGTCVHVVARY